MPNSGQLAVIEWTFDVSPAFSNTTASTYSPATNVKRFEIEVLRRSPVTGAFNQLARFMHRSREHIDRVWF
jgi:hypothetical protein